MKKNKKYHTVGRGPKSNRKIIERGKNDTPNTQIHVHDLSLKTLKSSQELKKINITDIYEIELKKNFFPLKGYMVIFF